MTSSFTEIEQEKWNNIKVLIVDDQLSCAQLVKSVLDKIAIKVIDIATCYQQALQLCQNHRYDIVLFDFHLNQNINGGELLTLLRKKNIIASNCGVIFSLVIAHQKLFRRPWASILIVSSRNPLISAH